MNTHKVEISDKKICRLVVDLVMPLFVFTFKGQFNMKDMVQVIVYACSQRISIDQATKLLKNAPKAPAIRYHLRNKLDLEDLEIKTNQILQKLAMLILSGKCLEFAIDLVFIPYHGEHKNDETEIVRSKAKNGTTHFHAYSTLYLVVLGKRFTLAIRYIKKGTSMEEIVNDFLEVISSLNLKIKRLYMDKGFCTVKGIKLLKRRHVRAVIAVPARGKNGGVKAHLKGKTRFISYTMKSKTGETVTFKLAIVCKYSKNKYGRKGSKYFAYAIIRGKIKPNEVYEIYRKRFGIESSYRIMNAARARTTSRSPELRLLYVAISLIIQNAWVYFNWSYMRERKQGVRKADNGLTFHDFIDFIAQACKAILGKITHVIAQNFPKFDLIRCKKVFSI